jgi:tetratricopeptide (TPR) repeat protein
MVFTTWIVGVLITNAENNGIKKMGDWWRSFWITAGLSACIGILFYILQAAGLVRIAQFVATNQDDLLRQANNLGGLLNIYYLYIFFLITGIAWGLSTAWSTRGKGTNVGWLIAPAALIVVWALGSILNLRVIHADMVYKIADPFTQNNQWSIATLLYRRAIQLVPNEDHYYISLARSYLEQAKGLTNTEEQEKLILKAEEDLKEAQRINPLNTDHTANLARLLSWWAGQTPDQQERTRRGKISSSYFIEAVKLSPNNSTLWGEWAFLFMDVLGDQDAAMERLNYALDLDDRYNYTQGLMGEFYLRLSRSAKNEAEKKSALEKAAEYYEYAVKVSTGKDAPTKPKYLITLGNTYIEIANLNPDQIDIEYLTNAIGAFTEALSSGINAADVWKIEETLAKLYIQLGDRSRALEHAELALASVPDTQKEQIIILIEQLKVVP